MLRAPPKIADMRSIFPAIGRWEEGLRRQQDKTGELPLDDGTKRSILLHMVPAKFSQHLKQNAWALNSYDKMKLDVMNLVSI